MRNLTIRARILILGLLAVGVLLLSGSFGIAQLSSFNGHLQADLTEIRGGLRTLTDIQTASIEFKTQVQEWKNILIRGNSPEQFARYEKAFGDMEQSVQNRLRKTLDALKGQNDPANAGVIAELEALIQHHAALGSAYRSALAGFDKADSDAGKKVDAAVKGKDRATTEGINQLVARIQKAKEDNLDQQKANATALYQSARNLLVGFITLATLLCIGIAALTVRSISRQIAQVQETTAAVKDSLDLTRRIPVSGTDEMAQVAISVNSLLGEFQSVVAHMKDAGDDVSRASDELSNSVGQLSTAVNRQNESTTSMAASVEEMAVSVTHVADASATAQGIAQDSLTQADQGGQVIEKTIRDMVAMAEMVQSTAQTMEHLGKRTDQIGNIAGVIKEIADQTNLLALNAAIEAARAGEQGRGFAVVADEVRKLAERTTTATKEIGGVITAIQDETRSAVDDMSRVVVQATGNADSARAAGESIARIRSDSIRVVEVASDIATALKEQSSASELIARQVEVIASMSEQNSIAMNEADSSSAEMKRLSGNLHQVVGRFRV